jgi:hypothetical protein
LYPLLWDPAMFESSSLGSIEGLIRLAFRQSQGLGVRAFHARPPSKLLT